jgi:hypothetical protein
MMPQAPAGAGAQGTVAKPQAQAPGQVAPKGVPPNFQLVPTPGPSRFNPTDFDTTPATKNLFPVDPTPTYHGPSPLASKEVSPQHGIVLAPKGSMLTPAQQAGGQPLGSLTHRLNPPGTLMPQQQAPAAAPSVARPDTQIDVDPVGARTAVNPALAPTVVHPGPPSGVSQAPATGEFAREKTRGFTPGRRPGEVLPNAAPDQNNIPTVAKPMSAAGGTGVTKSPSEASGAGGGTVQSPRDLASEDWTTPEGGYRAGGTQVVGGPPAKPVRSRRAHTPVTRRQQQAAAKPEEEKQPGFLRRWAGPAALGALGLGAYGLSKAVPWAAHTMENTGGMPMAYGGGWSPTPYGYGYTPYGPGMPTMGAGA